jgi:hypothetical protein
MRQQAAAADAGREAVRKTGGGAFRPARLSVGVGSLAGPSMNNCRFESFDPAEAHPLTRMWRESFEFGVGIKDP